MTSNLTKIQVVNNALNSIGERSISSIGGILGNVVASSLQEAIYMVCTSVEWSELRSIVNAESWAADSATMPSRTYRVREVYWYSSPTGSPEVAYDYNKEIIRFVSIQEYQTHLLTPYTGFSNKPLSWSKLTDTTIKVNPYPNDATERSKVFFEIYRYPEVPTGDTDVFNVTDLLLNLIQYKMSELLAIKHLNDTEQAAVYGSLYNKLKQTLIVSQNGTPSYNMYQGRRR